MPDDMTFKGDFKDKMYAFLQSPTRESFSDYIKYNTGECDVLDFKLQWIDGQKLAQIILGMANCGGGAIIFGVLENKDGTNEPVGLEKFKDKADIHKETEKYLPKSLFFEVYDLDFSHEVYSNLLNKKFQIVWIASNAKELPYVCEKSGDTLKEGMIYTRRGTNTVAANANELQRLIGKRIDSMYSNTSKIELEEHLSQLEVLYDNIEEEHSTSEYSIFCYKLKEMTREMFTKTVKMKNDKYPEEGFEDFIVRMIEQKKLKIEKVLDLK